MGKKKNFYETKKFLFRKISPKDVPQLKTLQNSSFPIQYSNDHYKYILSHDLTNLKKSQKYKYQTINGILDKTTITTGICVEKKNDGKIVGFVSCRVSRCSKRTIKLKRYDINKAYIMTLCVNEKFRRRGIAKKLVDIIESLAKRRYYCEYIKLHTKWDNHGALKFYKNQSFNVERICKKYYTINNKKEDAVKLKKIFYEVPGRGKLYGKSDAKWLIYLVLFLYISFTLVGFYFMYKFLSKRDI